MNRVAKEEMTVNLISVSKNDSLLTAYKKMQNNRIRHLPVTDADGNMVGILSDRDVSRAMHSHVIKNGYTKSEEITFDEEEQVQDYMSFPVRISGKNRALKDVAKEMVKEKVSALLVLDDDDSVLGIITTEDLLRVLIEVLDGPEPERVWNLDRLFKAPFKEAYA